MYLESRWLIDQKVAYMHFVHDVDAEYIHDIQQAVTRFLNEADGNPIYIVVETIPGLRIRIGIKMLHEMTAFMLKAPIQYLVHVGEETSYQRFMGQVLARSLGLKYQSFCTVEDALNFIEASNTNTLKQYLI